MKRIFLMLLCATMLWNCSEDAPTGNVGSIVGSVADYSTGSFIPVVNVVLTPGNKSTVTGSDGTFSFNNITEGEYTITISKEGYKPAVYNDIFVYADESTEYHLLLERIPAIVTADRNTLDYGADKSFNTQSFNIVNSSYEDLAWSIEENCEWITGVKPSSGTLKYGKTETIVVVIDRDKLDSGNNHANVVLRSSNGSTEVEVYAEGE